ncbi:MAG TPA: thioesterase domain-containing protein [Ktedonobacterales bacterium]|nr:thioesterase domain-containing protein [Ktedonobacterales bacterium]
MRDPARELQEVLAHEIPITTAIGIAVAHYDGETLTLTAPLRQNRNHKSTAFAGSLNALVTLTGWGLIWLILKERDIPATIVIQESTSRYLSPVRDDFTAHCRKPSEARLAAFETTLRRRGKARLELHVQIGDGATLAMDFTGRYVVHARERPASVPEHKENAPTP